jgi:hypothetical protein
MGRAPYSLGEVVITQQLRTTIGVKRMTKARLDKNRAPGQCYEGFICQLIDLWERVKGERENYVTGSTGGNQGASV